MFRFTAVSANKKTGPMPTTMTAKDSCPPTCPFKGNGCYAEGGPTNLWWNKCDMDEATFLSKVSGIYRGEIWRHDVAGDLLHDDGEIRVSFLDKLVKANKGKRGFTYTHHDLDKGQNEAVIRKAIREGFTINVSANNLDEAVNYHRSGLPTCVVVPSDIVKSFKHDGEQILLCPAVTSDKMNCKRCQLCQKADRKAIIGFPAHGNGKKKVDKIV